MNCLGLKKKTQNKKKKKNYNNNKKTNLYSAFFRYLALPLSYCIS